MSLMRSAATVGGFTMISRVLGFVRDQLIAFSLGTGVVASAFFVAQRFPNLFRALFAEGAFNSAFVPQFSRRVEADGLEEARKFACDVYSVLLAWLIVFCAACMVAMPLVIRIIAPGFAPGDPTYDLTVSLTRICFPYLLFMSLAALQSGVLNSLNRFTAAAAAPILLNLALIGANVIVWIVGSGSTPLTGYILAWGISVSGVAQFLLLAVACSRAGMRLVPHWPRMTPGVWRVLTLSVPGIISGGIMQINLVIATMLATTMDRAVSYLYYADRVYQLPLGVIGVAIGVVLLPDLSRRLRANDPAGVANSQNRALEMSLFLTLPSAVALVILPVPILSALFEHGKFTSSDTQAVALAIMAFACGLPAFAMTKVFQPGFYARENTRTPMIFAMTSVAVNIVASITLSQFFGYVGIAAATSLAAWTNTILLGLTLARRGHYEPDTRLQRTVPRIILASLVMGAVLIGLRFISVDFFYPGTGFFARASVLSGLIIAGIATYFAAIFGLRVMKPSDVRALVKRKPRP